MFQNSQNYRIRYVLEGVKKKESFITKRRKEKFLWEGVREILGAYSSELAVAIYHCYKVIVERKRTEKQLRVEKMGRQLAASSNTNPLIFLYALHQVDGLTVTTR